MNFTHLTTLFLGALIFTVSASSSSSLDEINSTTSRDIARAQSILTEANEKIFDENREQIIAVVQEHSAKVLGLLVEVPHFFDIDLNEILKHQGIVMNSTLSKRDFNFQKRSFWSFLQDVINSTLLAVGAIATVLSKSIPDLAAVANAAYAIHNYINN